LDLVKTCVWPLIVIHEAYNNTNTQEISKALHRANVLKGLSERIKIIYHKCENSVGINGKKSESFQTYRGVKQGSDSLHCCST
jgi:hypothetical protein